MPTLCSVPVIAGFAMPFYPMRPMHGPTIKTPEDLNNLDPRYHWTLKVNGDRASVGVVDHECHVQNRHGDWFKQSVAGMELYSALDGTWLLDGEVYKKTFYPFEVIVKEGVSLAKECPSVRVNAARELTKVLGLQWLYGEDKLVLNDWLAEAIRRHDGTFIEGVVGRRLGSAYTPMGAATHESTKCVKRKWVL